MDLGKTAAHGGIIKQVHWKLWLPLRLKGIG